MGVILEEVDAGITGIDTRCCARAESDGSPAKPAVAGTAALRTFSPGPSVEAMPDQEYVRSMEERYGIREEGLL